MAGFYCGEVGLGGSPGDGTCVVTGVLADATAIALLLNTYAAVPVPMSGRWMVTYQALLTAQNNGTRATLVPTTA